MGCEIDYIYALTYEPPHGYEASHHQAPNSVLMEIQHEQFNAVANIVNIVEKTIVSLEYNAL
jgi:hypothetical protein